ncbi:MAG TPA: hypothetical protein VLL97_02705 [Acidobacteriota bacterium]|nr:hypothetical protein [Acidobacteriota bacterium]
MKRFICIACAYAIFTILFCFGQSSRAIVTTSVLPGPEPGEHTISYTVSPPTATLVILTGRPYSGEELSRQTKTLPDGTNITQPGSSAIMYRDGSGRIRTERRMPRPMGLIPSIDPPVVPEIIDPVSGFICYLDTTNRVAHRVFLPPESFRIIPALPDTDFQERTTRENDSIRTYELLGADVIEGIEVEGRRITTTYAVETLGEDSPLVSTLEIWTSPELGITVLSKSTDPRMGEVTSAVINVSRGEPDHALFQAPPGYEIVDQLKVPFTFTVSITGAALP